MSKFFIVSLLCFVSPLLAQETSPMVENAQIGRYQMVIDSNNHERFLLDTTTGTVWKAHWITSQWTYVWTLDTPPVPQN